MKIVIVGGVAGGMSAATRLRRLNEDAEIIILEKGPYVSFANCGLPYFVSGEITKRSKLLVQTPESLKGRFELDVRVNTEALSIDPDKKEIMVRGEKGEYSIGYDKLILSPGARPFVPNTPGLPEAKNVFTMRNVPDVDAVTRFIDEKSPKKAVVIGAGFIGLEMAEALKHRGIDVTVVEMAPQVLPPFDYEMSVFVQEELEKNGIKLYTGVAASGFLEEGRIVELQSGERLESDLTIMSVGVLPENTLAQTAGIELGMRGGILVDENYETSARDIYAVGDAIIIKNQILDENTMIPLANPANRQGRQVADVISGYRRRNRGAIGTAIVRVFDLSAASVGLNERQLKAAGRNFKAVHVTANDHAGYFPGATSIYMKMLFDPEDGTIFGAQGVGQKGVDKRIDILATAIKGNLKVDDLMELEFTYAPPFGSAKDPVNMLGYAATNIMEGFSDNIQWYELEEMRENGAFLLDVREPGEVERGRIDGFVNIPLNDLRTRIGEIPMDRTVVVSCQSGQRSYMAERILKQKGYRTANLDGAFNIYSKAKKEEIR
ncbi:FAD-dependent oxidoreductase [Proteiniclasticum sp.]|uniref:FAD-dependent oxidoreductase n=1 Tax=Proteiniclasticum sp. TaxID=2053595 RepID=UPI00289DD908|nr:FAD-dependent oxidoreductase [Proteiniclasticum sp.]